MHKISEVRLRRAVGGIWIILMTFTLMRSGDLNYKSDYSIWHYPSCVVVFGTHRETDIAFAVRQFVGHVLDIDGMLFEELVGKLSGGHIRLELDKQEIAGARIHALHHRTPVGQSPVKRGAVFCGLVKGLFERVAVLEDDFEVVLGNGIHVPDRHLSCADTSSVPHCTYRRSPA